MKIGYIRVSTQEQNTIRQEELMTSLGVEPIYIDRMSGKNTNRPELQNRMVTEVYAHTFDGNRREIADKMDDLFFSPADTEEKSDTNQSQQILDALNKKPELVQLLTALLEKQ